MLTMTEDLVGIGVRMVEDLIQMKVMVIGVQMHMMEVVQMLMTVGMVDFMVEMMVDSMADQKVDVLKAMMILEVVETGKHIWMRRIYFFTYKPKISRFFHNMSKNFDFQ